MHMGGMPLYPPVGGHCSRENCIRMPLFQNEACKPPSGSCVQTVRLENPCCPGEAAEVSLSVDCCGNLEVCIHRDPCGCHRPQPRHRGREKYCW